MNRYLSIRWRMTVYYIGVLAVIVFVFGVLMSAMIYRHMILRIDSVLTEEARELADEIRLSSSDEENQSRFQQQTVDHAGFSFQISKSDGTVVGGSPWLRSQKFSSETAPIDAGENIQVVNFEGLGPHRVIVKTIESENQQYSIYVVVPLANIQREFMEFLSILLIAGSSAIVLACAGGFFIASRALLPLERITRTAERISAENLDVLIAVENPSDELGRLASTLNYTFQRLQKSINQMKRFTSDAAHDLRTPLSVLRTRLEVALRTSVDPNELKKSCQLAIDQTGKLTTLIDQLLLLSRQDAGIAHTPYDEVYLKPVIEDVVEMVRPLAVERGVRLEIAEISDCIVLGDDVSMSRLFFNLTENAVKYTGSGGCVRLSSKLSNGRLTVSVSDDGIGIDAEHLPKVFDRFYRVDPSRSGETGGAGLGLAICRAIVESHNGEISVKSIEGKGSTFTVSLPTIGMLPAYETSTEVQFV